MKQKSGIPTKKFLSGVIPRSTTTRHHLLPHHLLVQLFLPPTCSSTMAGMTCQWDMVTPTYSTKSKTILKKSSCFDAPTKLHSSIKHCHVCLMSSTCKSAPTTMSRGHLLGFHFSKSVLLLELPLKYLIQ